MNSTSEDENITFIIEDAFGRLNKLYDEEIYRLKETTYDDIVKMKEEMVNNTINEIIRNKTMENATLPVIPPFYFLLAETIMHLCIYTVGYLGNVITCIVILSNRSMRTTTNIYLFNLAIADLIMLTSGLFNYTLSCWYPYESCDHYGMKGCFFFVWESDVAVNVSILTIMAFTFERYLAICHPFLARKTLSVCKATIAIFVIWIIGIGYGILIFAQWEAILLYKGVVRQCIHDDATLLIVQIEALIFFVIPFILVIVLYSLIWIKIVASSKIQKNQGSTDSRDSHSERKNNNDTNRQILKMLVTIVAVFFVVWVPYHFVRLFLLHLHKLPFYSKNSSAGPVFPKIHLFLESAYLTVYFSSSAINPIIYNIMSKKFRGAFKKLFNCCHIIRLSQSKETKHKRGRKSSTTETNL